MQELRILLCSPGDVQDEREKAAEVVIDLNRHSVRDFGVRLNLFRWEIDAHPGFFAQGPQELIDSILDINSSDLIVCMFWTRLGTPLSTGKSGTEHEFEQAYQNWKKTGWLFAEVNAGFPGVERLAGGGRC